MDAGNSQGKRERQLPNLDALDPQALKALVLAQQSELDSRETEIESLKLLILKLKRMHFGSRAEKFDRDINSSNCGWKTWKPTRPPPNHCPRSRRQSCLTKPVASRRAVRSRLNCHVRQKRSRPRRKSVPTAAARCGYSAKTCARRSNMCRRASR